MEAAEKGLYARRSYWRSQRDGVEEVGKEICLFVLLSVYYSLAVEEKWKTMRIF